MTRRKSQAASDTAIVPDGAKAVVINAGQAFDSPIPHSWLQLLGDPAGAGGERIMHGTLRLHRGDNPQRASAEAFLRAKYRPADSADPLAITALRAEVLVPARADDCFAYPWLLGAFVDHGLARETDGKTPLCCYWTVSDGNVRHLHEQWREGRAVAADFVDRFSVPIVLVQHAREQKLRHQAPHLHLIAARWTLGSPGFGAPVTDLKGRRPAAAIVEAGARYPALPSIPDLVGAGPAPVYP